MTSRPQPVTSKFRRYYNHDILPFYNSSKLSHSNSSAGSTSSLTSILHHESFHGDNDSLQYDSHDDCSIISHSLHLSKFPEESFQRLNVIESNNIFNNKQMRKTRKQNGIFREIINPSDTNHMKIIAFHSQRYKPTEKSCKRIIARKPDYPGSRVTHINYNATLSHRKLSKSAKSVNNNSAISQTKEKKLENPQSESVSTGRQILRPTANKKDISSENLEKEASIRIRSAKSNVDYSVCDFTSVSKSDKSNQRKTGKTKRNNENNLSSSVDDVHSISIDDASSVTDNINDPIDRKQPQRILTAWEDWYLRKEKEYRKTNEKDRRKMLSEEEKKKELENAKEQRREICQKKINEWLKKKEVERLKSAVKEKKEKEKNKLKEFEKDDKSKKSSEKYTIWKSKKTELQKEHEQQEKEKLQKQEEEKCIKQAKAEKAFTKWLEGHRDHQMPIPYSYGISDGRLTSYYDKTSNPPPTYFNPKAWIPVIEAKQ